MSRYKNWGRASDWRAALLILTTAFAEDGRVWQHVNLDREEISVRKILGDGTFSSGERMLLAIAASVFNQKQRINVGRSSTDMMIQMPL
jgi:hypothetical protein